MDSRRAGPTLVTQRRVIDASALWEYLTSTPLGVTVGQFIGDDVDLHMPDLCAIEVVSAARGNHKARRLSQHAASMVIAELVEFPATVHPSDPLLDRMWELRDNVTTYDATYVALSEALDAALITTDRKLARGLRSVSEIEVVVAS